MSANKVRPLLIAEAANPEWVSVPLVGWSLARALQKLTGGHIVTQIRNKAAFERAGLIEGRDFTALDTEWLMGRIHKFTSAVRMGWTFGTAMSSLAYPVFERQVWSQFAAQIKNREFNVVHRITPLTPTANSYLAHRCATVGVPFILGPLNGGVPWPSGFHAELRREREYLAYFRSLYKLNPARTRSLASARAIIAGSRHTASEIPARHADKITVIPENAIDPSRFNLSAAQDISGPLRGVFIGRLVPYKGPDILLDAALPLLKSGQLVLDIIGDGPMMTQLRAFCDGHKLIEAVKFHGWVDHRSVQSIAAQSNLLTFPSVREFGGGVVLEAMALGVVPLVVDYAGPGELVGQGLGYKIPIGSRAEIVKSLRDQLRLLCDNPFDLPMIAQQCRTHVQGLFTWSCKAKQVRKVYEWALTGPYYSEPIPTFDFG